MEMKSMRKLICLVLVLLLCVCLAAPVFAAEDSFVPSITYKPNPEVVEVPGEDDEPYIGLIRDDQGEIIDYVGHGCLVFKAGNTDMIESDYKYDPRVTWIEDRYWITWCNGYHGPTIGIGYTFDFKEFFQCENAFLPFNRNGVLFPQKINGKYAMLSRPSDNGHTPFGDIYLSYSPDMKYWGEHRNVMKVTPFEQSAWQCTKIGAGSVPILTDEGWLMFYHGVITTCNGFRYSMGAVLLDKEDPTKVLYRSMEYLLAPAAPYELVGDVPNVVFPCAALSEGDKVTVYYGAADTHTCIAFGRISEIIEWLKKQ